LIFSFANVKNQVHFTRLISFFGGMCLLNKVLSGKQAEEKQKGGTYNVLHFNEKPA
jgi:hypothetical protein